jgi:signal transduction histidine kinase
MVRGKADPESQTITILHLRWVLIVATGYLLLFQHLDHPASPIVHIFLAGYLASNLVVAALLRRSSSEWLTMGVALFDAAAVSGALLVGKDFSSDFFLLYFVVILLATQTERLGFVVVIAVAISFVHLYATTDPFAPMSLLGSGALVRISFLFVVALFFGRLVERVRAAERLADEARRNEKIVTDSIEEVVRAFKIPLGSIHAIAEILLESLASRTDSLTREQVELLRRIHANSRHVSRFASSLLDARHVEAHRLRLDREPANLSSIVEELLRVVTTASDLKGISLELESAPGMPRVDVDVDQIDRAVWILLDNAIRSAPAGGEVFVSLDHTDLELVLSVSDDGQGVSAADLPAIFDKLRHLNGGFESSGFGLFIAKAIVEAHGGTIVADSEIGGGTTLTVRLPIRRQRTPISIEARV